MKKVSITLILIFLYPNFINAQIPFTLSNSVIFIPSGKSVLANGENYYLSILENGSNSFNFYYKGSVLGFRELSTYGISGGYQISEYFKLYLGSGFFGFDLMNEFNVTSSLLLNLENLSLGIAGQFNRAYIKDFTSENLFSFDLFGKLHYDYFSMGFLINNINQSQYSNYENVINQRAVFSLGYEFSDQIAADIGTVIVINSKSSVLFGAKYSPVKEIAVNLKYLTNNQRIDLGIAFFPIEWFKLNFFFTHQPVFGMDYCIINEINW